MKKINVYIFALLIISIFILVNNLEKKMPVTTCNTILQIYSESGNSFYDTLVIPCSIKTYGHQSGFTRIKNNVYPYKQACYVIGIHEANFKKTYNGYSCNIIKQDTIVKYPKFN